MRQEGPASEALCAMGSEGPAALSLWPRELTFFLFLFGYAVASCGTHVPKHRMCYGSGQIIIYSGRLSGHVMPGLRYIKPQSEPGPALKQAALAGSS